MPEAEDPIKKAYRAHTEAIQNQVTELTKKLIDQGKIIEAGWVGMQILALPRDASETQVREMRNAFFAGAHHLFASIMVGMEEDAEPTPADMKRMDMIDKELKQFVKEFTQRGRQAGRG